MCKKYRQFEGGRRWRITENKQIEVEDQGIIRTKGDPISTYTAWIDFKNDIMAAYERFGIHPLTIIAMMLIEATRMDEERSHMDPQCDRKEDGYVSDRTTPHRRSRGLMQTLLSTAQEVNERFKLFLMWDGTIERLSIGDLNIPHKSIMLGTAFLRYQADRYADQFPDDDPVMLTGPYNAGSLRRDKPDKEGRLNPFMMRTYGPYRTEKFIRYYNDAHAMLTHLGVIDGQGEVVA